MIRVHALVFITLLELVVVSAALWLVWFFKARTLNRRLAALRLTPENEQAGHGDGAYFVKELVATRAQIDILAKDGPDVPLAGLKLRAAYLDLERELAQGRQRDVAFWDQLQQQLAALLEAYAPATSLATASDVADENPGEPPAGDDENNDSLEGDTSKVGTQASVLGEFRGALGELLADQQQYPEMRVHADKLMRCSRELAMCMSILEDDNSFLREKLKTAGLLDD